MLTVNGRSHLRARQELDIAIIGDAKERIQGLGLIPELGANEAVPDYETALDVIKAQEWTQR